MEPNDLQYTIIIPTYNRHNALAICLGALAQVVVDFKRLEVIVVDDGSLSPPYEVVNGAQQQLNARLICQSNSGPASARNTGAWAAKAKHLVFIDDDCTPGPDWLCAYATLLDQYPDTLLGGPVVNGLPTNLYDETTQMIITYFRENDRDPLGNPKFFTTNNMVVPRKEFLEMGGFNIKFRTGEDREFCHRWRTANRPIVEVPEAIVAHWKDLDLQRFWKLHLSYGRGSAAYRQLIAQRDREEFKLETWRIYWHLLSCPFAKYDLHHALPISGLLLLSQLATISAYIAHGLNNRS